MAKRGAETDGSSSQPPQKKVQFEQFRIGPISTLEEMDIKVLQFKNKKLAQRLDQRHRVEAELRQRIEQLEKRQTQDDAVLNVVNRYWNQLNEDIRVLLQRFDAETADESENKNEGEATTSFLLQLSTWDKEELDDKLANRVQVSKRAVAKVIQAFDRLMQRNEKITLALKGELESGGEFSEHFCGFSIRFFCLFDYVEFRFSEEAPVMDEVIRQANIEIQAENRNLQALNTSLHKKYHTISLKMSELQDTVTQKETEAAELRNQVDDLRYELSKLQDRNDKLEHHLAEAIEKLKNYQSIQGEEKGAVKPSPVSNVSQKKVEELAKDLEEMRELANNRLTELDRLHLQHRETLKEVEKLKMDIRQLPESVIVETTEYKCLQSQFSVLYNESMQLKTQLDEVRHQLQTSKNSHLRQIEMMESEELMGQKKLRTEVIQLEDMLAQVRKEYEMLRIEFEQNLAANEQTGPINREMRHLITSLQNHNQQLKGEVHRYKRKYKDTNAEMAKLFIVMFRKSGAAPGGPGGAAVKKEIKKEPAAHRDPHRAKDVKVTESEMVRDLKAQLKKTACEQKEMKLLLDMYKGVSKEQRDKVQLMAAEKKLRAENEELRQQLKKESKREERKKMADEDAMRKIKHLEEQHYLMQKQVATHKQEEEALLNEMEVTGQAFEDMQEQNSRLIQQLREKDDANFKLMSERIKSNQLHKLSREEKEALKEQEEIAQLRRKTERMKKIELAGTLDEVMMEEIREYKEILTCPSCKVKRKDGVLSKCFHVFCYDCLKTRYETRQRKCPKCNAAFGANDYHRLYLGS
ncbi:unnamed protein product [Nesidiocoris tenuis]|uniref:E3 ubiquitin protein ligase n=1 Tax=Nesidiocoris tenuis TaxID=355587 RepID=A0A6H5H3K9_9HEMI|nr:unnamed protein product [Nesidiocoris tenuis]